MKRARQSERRRELKQAAEIEASNQERVTSKRRRVEELDKFQTHEKNKKESGEKDEVVVLETALRDWLTSNAWETSDFIFIANSCSLKNL